MGFHGVECSPVESPWGFGWLANGNPPGSETIGFRVAASVITNDRARAFR